MRAGSSAVPTLTSSSCTTPRDPWRVPALFDAVVDAVTDGADARDTRTRDLTDTVKRVARKVTASSSRERSNVKSWSAVQTPQAFRRDAARARARQRRETRPTTPRSSRRWAASSWWSCRASRHNVKITQPEDLELLSLYERRARWRYERQDATGFCARPACVRAAQRHDDDVEREWNRAGRLVMNRLVLPGRLRVWIGAEI